MNNITLVSELSDRLGLKTQAGRIALAHALANIQLLDKKQQDYGSKNISNFGLFGLLVRLNDKFERMKNLLLTKHNDHIVMKDASSQNESIDDTFMDISNYAIISVMVRNGEWPNE